MDILSLDSLEILTVFFEILIVVGLGFGLGVGNETQDRQSSFQD